VILRSEFPLTIEEIITMAAVPSLDPARLLSEQLESASPDLLRSLLATFIQTLMGAEADAICGAPYGTVSEGRVNVRNGYRHRDFDTRVGTIDSSGGVRFRSCGLGRTFRTGCWSGAGAPRRR
jgi:hypothetical protein